jgi:small-conductance mechanosensitive channel
MHLAIYMKHGHEWMLAVFLLSGAILFSNVVHGITFAIIKRRRKDATPQQNAARPSIYRHLNHPARWVFLTICVLTTFPWLPIPAQIATPLRLTLHIVLVVLSGWFAVGCVYVMQDALTRRYDIKAENNVRARRIHTQMQVLRRVLISFIIIIDIGCLLWTFPDPQLWHYGSGLLASAGVATLVLATALKPTVGNLLAGLQIAFAEPIRIDDVVIVQGEWGRIEEITTTYVVVCIWDLRRLIVPLSYFIENPFQNWTRERSDLLGTAFLYTDYSVPVAAIREHFAKVLEGSPLWDRKVCSTQVTNLSEHTMEIRCLLSARNASEQFDLRCLVREEMVRFIQENYPDAFPRTRFSSLPSSGEGTSVPGPGPAKAFSEMV